MGLRDTALPSCTWVEPAIIVSKLNPHDHLSFSELREYFLAERSSWSAGAGKVRVVRRAPGEPEREAVLRLIYDMNEKDFNSYFLGKKSGGKSLKNPGSGARRPT